MSKINTAKIFHNKGGQRDTARIQNLRENNAINDISMLINKVDQSIVSMLVS
jgi:hypothetical protein